MLTQTSKLPVLLSVLTALTAGVAHAQSNPEGSVFSESANILSTSEDATCSQIKDGPKDELEHPVRYTKQSQMYAGQCVDTNKFRRGIIDTAKSNSNFIVVHNYRHNDEFWTAEIPLKAAAWDKAYFHIVRFPVVKGVEAAHTQMRFVTNKSHPIRLVAQKDGKVAYTNDFIYSVEAALPPGVGYNFALGALQNYAIVGRIVSGKQRATENMQRNIEQYRLNLTSDEVASLAKQAVYNSDKMNLNKFYSTVRPNCTSEAFDLIDTLPKVQAMIKSGAVKPFNTVMWVDPIAGPSIKALAKRQLLGQRDANLGDEIFKGSTTPPAVENTIGIIREIPGSPYTLVTIVPQQPHSEEVRKLILNQLQVTMANAVPHLAQAAITSGLIGDGVPGILQGVLKGIHKEIVTFERNVNNSLPDSPVDVVTYLVPWFEGKDMSVAINNAPADLPFNSQVYPDGKRYRELNQDETKQVLNWMGNSFRLVQAKNYNKPGSTPVYLLGAAIKMKLQKSRSQETLQLALSWTNSLFDFQTYSDQLEFTHIYMPSPKLANLENKNNLPLFTEKMGAVVITHKQDQIHGMEPKLHFDFGTLDNIQNKIGDKNFGLLGVKKPALENLPLVGMCGDRANVVPELTGKFLAKPTTIKAINDRFGNKPLSLGFYEFDMIYSGKYCENSSQYSFNPEIQAICEADRKSKSGIVLWNVDVRANVQVSKDRVIDCIHHGMISDQFKDQANDAIDMQIDDAMAQAQKKVINAVFGGATK